MAWWGERLLEYAGLHNTTQLIPRAANDVQSGEERLHGPDHRGSEAHRAPRREQLSGILDHFQVLNDIDTSDVPPTAQSLDQVNVTREDALRPSLPTDDVLANAPRAEDGYLRVRAVLD